MKRIFLLLCFFSILIFGEDNYKKKIIYSGVSSAKAIALTFDDGPDSTNTAKVLDILKKNDVKATFFILGQNINQTSSILVQRIYDEGHVIGNHSYTHGLFYNKGEDAIRREIIKTQEVIKKVIGKEPALFRPPYGAVSKTMIEFCGSQGIKVINWNVDTNDWRKTVNSEDMIKTITSGTSSNRIVLMHTMKHLSKTPDALEVIIPILKKQGFSIITLDKLLGVEPYKN